MSTCMSGTQPTGRTLIEVSKTVESESSRCHGNMSRKSIELDCVGVDAWNQGHVAACYCYVEVRWINYVERVDRVHWHGILCHDTC